MCKSKWDKMLDKKIINLYDTGISIHNRQEPFYAIAKSNLISRISEELKIKRYYVDKPLEQEE